MNITADQPAFPIISPIGTGVISPGMTLRQYYAGQAMQGLLANPKVDITDQRIVSSMLIIVDALINALNKQP